MPEPKAGEILVRVGAAGVSFAAMLGVQGKHQNKPALPYVPGNEMAGHVVKLGPGVTNLAVGQRVTTGVSQGAYAEYAVAAAANAVPIPETMPYAQATNFPTLYPTAYGALKWKADMQPGEVLLVHGAGGGSGLTGHRGRQGDGRRRHRLGGRRGQARGRPRSRRRSPDRLPHRGLARAGAGADRRARRRRDLRSGRRRRPSTSRCAAWRRRAG